MKPRLRLTQVHEIQDLGPHMRRIVLRGDDLKDFPVGQEAKRVLTLKLSFLNPVRLSPNYHLTLAQKNGFVPIQSEPLMPHSTN